MLFYNGGALRNNSQHEVVSTCSSKEEISPGRVSVRLIAHYILVILSLTAFLGWCPNLPQFHPGISARRYVWSCGNVRKLMAIFVIYNFPHFMVVCFSVPGVAAMNMCESGLLGGDLTDVRW